MMATSSHTCRPFLILFFLTTVVLVGHGFAPCRHHHHHHHYRITTNTKTTTTTTTHKDSLTKQSPLLFLLPQSQEMVDSRRRNERRMLLSRSDWQRGSRRKVVTAVTTALASKEDDNNDDISTDCSSSSSSSSSSSKDSHSMAMTSNNNNKKNTTNTFFLTAFWNHATANNNNNNNATTITTTTTTTIAASSATTFIMEVWNKMKWGVASFVAGMLVTGAALIVPIYNDVQLLSLSQPVTLFETILQDLDQAYVDPVDTNKLFETGVAAMLRSLDPYTEFEGKEEAVAMAESIDGRYGGVGLVIAGNTGSSKITTSTTTTTKKTAPQILPDAAQQDNQNLLQQQQQQQQLVPSETMTPTPGSSSSSSSSVPIASAASVMEQDDMDDDEDYDYIAMDEDEDEEDFVLRRQQEKMRSQRAREQGIRVVSAFEGYAFDYGMRVGDKLLAVDDLPITPGTSVEQVRNTLRGEPGTMVTIKFERDGVEGVQSVTMPRTVVRVRDVKLATLVGDPADGIGYIQLAGFASDTGREMRSAIQYLQRAAEDASNGERSLQGLVLDMRGNPGGLLTSAVDVCSLLLPKDSDIVSARGRGFPGLLYRSRVDPILDSQTKLAVLVNGNTASAAEIVSGAVQDLDVGVIIGSDRTFGKGLVQNVESLPYQTALKFTVAKYYTPSGRCIQGIKYQEGGGLKEDARYVAKKVSEKDRSTFFTRNGRVVRDGGGIEADLKVQAAKASPLEIILLRSGLMNEFAARWSKNHELTNNFEVDDGTYKEFQAFVAEKQKKGEIELEVLYNKPLSDLRKTLKASGYTGAEKSVDQLQARIVREIQNDFNKYRKDIKEDISASILARYIPESMLIERGIKTDVQVNAAVKLLRNDNQYNKLLARDISGNSPAMSGNSINVASDKAVGARGSIKW